MKTGRRISRTAQEWKGLVEQWSRSGESQREFCAKRGIGLSSFIRWRRICKRKPSDEAFVALGPVLPPAPTAGTALVIRLPGEVELVLSRMPDAEWLRRVLKA